MSDEKEEDTLDLDDLFVGEKIRAFGSPTLWVKQIEENEIHVVTRDNDKAVIKNEEVDYHLGYGEYEKRDGTVLDWESYTTRIVPGVVRRLRKGPQYIIMVDECDRCGSVDIGDEVIDECLLCGNDTFHEAEYLTIDGSKLQDKE